MKYLSIGGTTVPKHPIYGPRPREGLVLDDWEWFGICDNMNRRERDRQIAELYRLKELQKREMSYNMTKNWQNTLASIKTQSEQRRIEKREKDKQEKIEEYNKILQTRKEERKPMLEAARRTLFEMKDSTRRVVSALVECEVKTEQLRQIEFNKKLREEAELKAEREKESFFFGEIDGGDDDEDDDSSVDAEELNAGRKMKKDSKEMAELESKYKKRKKKDKAADGEDQEEEEGDDDDSSKKGKKKKKLSREQKRKIYMKELKKQVEENRKRERERIEREEREIKEDIEKMIETMKKLKQCREEEIKEEIKRREAVIKKGYHQLELERNRIEEEMEEDEINQIYLKYEKRFCEMRKATERKMVNETVERRQKLTDLLSKRDEKRDREEEMFQKAFKEKMEQQMKAQREEMEAKRKADEEMDKWYQEFLVRRAREIHLEKESAKWDILQACRKYDMDLEWMKARKERLYAMEERRLEDLRQQMREKKEMMEEEIRREMRFERRDQEREQFMKYAEEAVEYARSQGWTDEPLLRLLQQVKEENEREEAEGGARKKREMKEGGSNKPATGPQKYSKPTGGPLNSACYCFRN